MMYICNRRTKVIHTEACFCRRLMKSEYAADDFKEVQELVDRGYTFCEHCSPVYIALKKENQQIKAYCKSKKISYHYEKGWLDVQTPYGSWRVIPHLNGKKLDLFHENHKQLKGYELFVNFHRQKIKKESLYTIIDYIFMHDEFREKTPRGVKKPKKNENLRKGSKRYKKQQGVLRNLRSEGTGLTILKTCFS